MVQISVDTQKDSLDDIKKAIKFLQEFIGESPALPEVRSQYSYESSTTVTSSSNDLSEKKESPALSSADTAVFSMFSESVEGVSSDTNLDSVDAGKKVESSDPVIEIVEF